MLYGLLNSYVKNLFGVCACWAMTLKWISSHIGSQGLGGEAPISLKSTKNLLRVVKRQTDGRAVETTRVMSSGKLVSGEFMSVQHLVMTVRPFSLGDGGPWGPTVSPPPTQPQPKPESAGASCHWSARWLDFSVIRPRTEKLLRVVSLEDPKIFFFF